MGYRWVKLLPFNVMLVHTVCYEKLLESYFETQHKFPGFTLMSEEEIAQSKAFKISVPLKRGSNEK